MKVFRSRKAVGDWRSLWARKTTQKTQERQDLGKQLEDSNKHVGTVSTLSSTQFLQAPPKLPPPCKEEGRVTFFSRADSRLCLMRAFSRDDVNFILTACMARSGESNVEHATLDAGSQIFVLTERTGRPGR